MSRRRLDRVLPNFSVTTSGPLELTLPQLNECRGLDQGAPRAAQSLEVVGNDGERLRPSTRTRVIGFGHVAEVAIPAAACQPVIAGEQTDERARR